MRKVWAVVRREFVERVRSKWFWVSAVLAPVFLALLFFLPLVVEGAGGTRDIAVVDRTSTDLGRRVTEALAATPVFRVERVVGGRGSVDSLTREVAARRLDGFLIVTDSLLERGTAEYRASNVSLRDVAEVQRTLGRLVVVVRLERSGVDPGVVARAQRPIELATKKIAGASTTAQSSAESFSLAYLMAFLIYTAIIVYGVSVKSSVLEEKTTRIVEILVSAMRPFELLAGKVLGVGAVSLFQFLIWGVAARLLIGGRGAFTAGLSDGDAGQVLQVPHLAAPTALVLLGYFLGGFLLYSAMFAAVGAMSSSEQEAQQAQQPIVYILVASLVAMFAVLNDPASRLARTLSLVPFSSPIAMPVRWAAGSVGVGELVLSFVLLGAGIVLVTWVAARIYRVGILMTGKRPSLRELIAWVRA